MGCIKLPEFKIVVSNPYAKNVVEKVKVQGDDNLKYEKEHKEGRVLPIAKLNSKLAEKLGVKDSVLLLRFKGEAGKKIKMHLRVQIDDSIEDGVVKVPTDLIAEKVGELEAEAEAMPSRAWQITLDEAKSRKFIGLRIKDEVDASIIGFKGKLVITGGSDNSGFPMRPDIPGGAKKRVLLSQPPGFRPKRKGERRRKTVRGNMITEDIVQINTVLKLE